MGYLTFALNYKMHGPEVTGYHSVNLAVHIFNSLLLYVFVVLTFNSPYFVDSPMRSYSARVALLSALLFAVHPIQTEAVTYVYQRVTSLMAFFYLISLTAYAASRLSPKTVHRHALLALSVVSAVLAMKTKENAFTLPFAVVLYELSFFKGKRGERFLRLLPFLATIPIVPLSVIGPEGSLAEALAGATRVELSATRTDYLITQSRVIITYLRLLFLPANQNLDYAYPVYNSAFTSAVAVSLAIVFLLIVSTVYSYLRSNRGNKIPRLFGFCSAWFFLTLSVESSLIALSDLIFEHRLYLPSIGIFILASSGGMMLAGRLMNKQIRTVLLMIFLCVPLLFSVFTYVRNNTWRSAMALWGDVVEKSPGKARGHSNLGEAYLRAGLPDEAIIQYEVAVGLGPDLSKLQSFEEARNIDPNFARAYNNLGLAYLTKGMHDEAISSFKSALKLRPDDPRARLNLEIAYRKKSGG